jgi:hypothetical protein
MFCFKPSLDPGDAAAALARLVLPKPDPMLFKKSLHDLQRLFDNYSRNCPPACIATGITPTAEQHYQSELWLPLAEIRPCFYRLYRCSLTFPPILSSTVFNNAASWLDIANQLPNFLPSSSLNPARLLSSLLDDDELRTSFLFWSFMPQRFYGNGSNRYPQQSALIRSRLLGFNVNDRPLRSLDAACGDGSATYALASIMLEAGLFPEQFSLEGWTLDPLEAWAAAHALFPHAPAHQALLRQNAEQLSAHATESILFRQADLFEPQDSVQKFDLIICNGLLGGPIINTREEISRIVCNLASMMNKNGLLLAADNFHGGWKQKCPQEVLQALFKQSGLEAFQAGEGIAGIMV